VNGEKSYPTRGDPVCAKHSGSKGVNLEKNPQSYGVSAVPMGWKAMGESVSNGTLGIPGDLPEVI